MNSNQEFHSLRVEITVCRIFERPFKSFAKKALGFTSRHHIKNACWVLFDKVVKLAQNILSMKNHEINRSSSNKILQKISLSPRRTDNEVQMPLIVNQSMMDNVNIAKSYNRENQILFRRSSPKP